MTSVFGLVYRLQGEGEDQYLLFVLGLFVWEQLLDVLEVFVIYENESRMGHRSLGKVHISSKSETLQGV